MLLVFLPTKQVHLVHLRACPVTGQGSVDVYKVLTEGLFIPKQLPERYEDQNFKGNKIKHLHMVKVYHFFEGIIPAVPVALRASFLSVLTVDIISSLKDHWVAVSKESCATDIVAKLKDSTKVRMVFECLKKINHFFQSLPDNKDRHPTPQNLGSSSLPCQHCIGHPCSECSLQ